MTTSPGSAPMPCEALDDRQRRGAAEAVVVDVERPGEVERVVDLLRGFGGRHAVLELERSRAGLDLVGRAERLERRLRHLRAGSAGAGEGRN